MIPKCMPWLDAYDEPIGDIEDKVDNLSPQSTPYILPSFEIYTSPVTYPEEVEETIGIPMEAEPLENTKLKGLGLNTCDHDIPFSSKEVPIFNEPEPQPNTLPTCPTLDVSLGDKRGPEPPIKPLSPDSFRTKVVDLLTIHTPPLPHLESFHPKDTYCHYHPCIDDPKKHYGFKPGLLRQIGSLGVMFSNLEMIENDWGLESKEVSFLGRGLNSPVRPKEVEKVRSKETHHLEHIIQQPIFQHVTPFHNNGRKVHLLEDKQIPSIGVFDEVFSTWMAFGGNTRNLGSFGEETDKITDLHQIHEEVLFTERGDDIAGIKRRHHDLSSDGVRDLVTASGRGRLKGNLESST
ncbi:hypothetical protein Tco_0452235 [Tanacetum coccineum]